MYRQLSMTYEHYELVCEVLGFRDGTDAQPRAPVRVLRGELAYPADRARPLAFARR